MAIRSSARPPESKANGTCVHCRATLQPAALVCTSCHNYQMPSWMAAVLASPLFGLVRYIFAALLLWGVSTLYQHRDSALRETTERALTLSRNSMQIQVLAEQLIRPCPLTIAADCSARYESLLRDFAANAYGFKEEAKYLFYGERRPGGDSIYQAIEFIDDFYNPTHVAFGQMLAMPVQVELLRARPLLTVPISDPRVSNLWCSLEGRARMRSLMISLDVYRYCYQQIRSYARESSTTRIWTPWRGRLDLETRPAYHDCASPDAFEDKVNTIASKIGRLSADHSAPWVYDSVCDETPMRIGGQLIPPIEHQLIVVIPHHWESQRARVLLLRCTEPTKCRRLGRTTTATLPKGGTAWGRGLQPFPEVDEAPGTFVRAPGDRRAPAGVFLLEFGHDAVTGSDQRVDEEGATRMGAPLGKPQRRSIAVEELGPRGDASGDVERFEALDLTSGATNGDPRILSTFIEADVWRATSEVADPTFLVQLPRPEYTVERAALWGLPPPDQLFSAD